MHQPPPLSQAADPEERRLPLSVLTAALLLYALRFGYDYGVSDQDEILPYLLHRLVPDLFTQDWFVMTQASAFGIRTFFVGLLQGLALVLPVWLSILALYVATWLLLAAAVYRLGSLLTQNRVAASAAVVAALVLTPQWTLGGNDLVHTMLVPSMVGWTLGLWGIVFFLQKRLVRAGVLLGVATWMQALVGLQGAGLLGLILIWRLARRDDPLRALLVFGGTYALSALPALGPLVVQQGTTSLMAPPEAGPSLFYIRAQFRNPHHYLFFAFPARSLVRFGLVAGLGGLSAVYLARTQRLHHRDFLGSVLVLITLFGLLAFLFTEVVPVLFVASLQLFKMTVLAKLLLVIMICGAVAAVLPDRFSGVLRRLTSPSRWVLGLVLGAWLLVLGGAVSGVDGLHRKARPLVRRDTPVGAVEQWAQAQTPREAVFAVPPSWSGFRSHARRAIVVNYKAVPHRDDHVYLWFTRLMDVAPVELPARGNPALLDQLDAAFMQQPSETLLRLAGDYDVAYVVRRLSAPLMHPSFEHVHTSEPWLVYRIRRDAEGGR